MVRRPLIRQKITFDPFNDAIMVHLCPLIVLVPIHCYCMQKIDQQCFQNISLCSAEESLEQYEGEIFLCELSF